LVHPAKPAASDILNHHISPSVSRLADDLLAEHVPVTSRGGLVLFRRRRFSNKLSNLCLYDIFNGHRIFFTYPPGVIPSSTWLTRYVLLTAEDGIDTSSLLFALHHANVPGQRHRSTMEIHTATPLSRTWAPVITSHTNREFFTQHWPARHENIVVLDGGVIHWVVHKYGEIAFYNVYTREHGTIKLPGPVIDFNENLHFGSYYSRNGKKLLRLFTYNRFEISVWDQLPNGDWALEAVTIDIEEKLQSLDSNGQPYQDMIVEFKCSSEKNNIVLLRTCTLFIILDLDTKVMCEEKHCPTSSSMLMEIDLSSRLRAMKVYHP
jgi:hypothetical protein